MPEVQTKGGLEAVEFFGDIDKVWDKGAKSDRIASEYPAWYFKPQVRDLQDGISRLKGELDRGEIPERGKPASMAELRKLQEKLDKIEASRPVLTDASKDALLKVRKELGNEIRETMFSRSDEAKGLPDAHEEFERQTMPCIKLRGDAIVIAKKIGCKVSRDGEVSRNDASRIWKIAGRALGENTNTEVLRKS